MLSRFALLSFLIPSVLCIWPAPRSTTNGNSTLTLASGFTINGPANAPQDLQDAISRTMDYLKSDQLGRLIVGRGQTDSASFTSAKALSSLTLSFTGTGSIQSISAEAIAEITTRNDAYVLNVPSDGTAATLSASSSLGLFRGLTTFAQLWYDYDGTTYTTGTPVKIQDNPAFPYRGFMLDTSRNYFPVADILRTIDAMSWIKLNTLHWHVVDSQSFPIQIPSFPELSSKGAYGSALVYTASDVQNIVSYAAARGIDVLAEFDMPGHTAVIAESHPEHVACSIVGTTKDYDGDFANEPPQGQLRFAVPATQNFTTSVLKSFSSMFSSKLFSIGGDEINMLCYQDDAATQSALSSAKLTFEQALSKFTQATQSVLTSAGKTPVVWEEMVLDHNVTLSNNTVVMVWISSANAKSVAAKNLRIVHAPSDYFYLDCGAGEWINSAGGANSWCDPFKSWQKAYSFNPFNGLTTAQQKLVLGGEQLLWTEQSGPENLDSIVWPRAAVAAEVFWTGAILSGGAARNTQEALPRLHDIRYRMVQRGVKAINLQPMWCALRPNQCDG